MVGPHRPNMTRVTEDILGYPKTLMFQFPNFFENFTEKNVFQYKSSEFRHLLIESWGKVRQGQHQVRKPIIQNIFQTVIVVCRPSLSRAQRGGAEVELPRGTVESGAVLLADAHLVPEHRLLPIPLPLLFLFLSSVSSTERLLDYLGLLQGLLNLSHL